MNPLCEAWKALAGAVAIIFATTSSIAMWTYIKKEAQKGAKWCDWCDNVADAVSPYGKLMLCRHHYTKCTIVGPDGKNATLRGY